MKVVLTPTGFLDVSIHARATDAVAMFLVQAAIKEDYYSTDAFINDVNTASNAAKRGKDGNAAGSRLPRILNFGVGIPAIIQSN
jgi:hypothetical protein